MMTKISHLVFGIRPENQAFYKDLMTFLGWQQIYADHATIGLGNTDGASIWFGPQLKDVKNDYDGPGLNHIAIGVPAQTDVDLVCGYLKDKGIEALFETPRYRPEFSRSDAFTYYQVMFESPDRILFEVVYTGPKEA